MGTKMTTLLLLCDLMEVTDETDLNFSFYLKKKEKRW